MKNFKNTRKRIENTRINYLPEEGTRKIDCRKNKMRTFEAAIAIFNQSCFGFRRMTKWSVNMRVLTKHDKDSRTCSL